MTKSCFFFKSKPKPVKEKQQEIQNPVFSEPEPDWACSEPIDIPSYKDRAITRSPTFKAF